MRFGVLGATAAWREDGAVVAVGGPRSRALLALLALDAGHFISPERLIDGMYGESPPDGAANALQSQVSRLRTALKELIAEHPLRERSRAQLVRTLNAVGRTADALTAFEDARRILADELGADPGPELAEAHLAVLRGDTERPSIPALPAQLTSFVGRGEELRRISELLSRSRLVTLTGPGGTGKTRLAIETASAEAGPVAFLG